MNNCSCIYIDSDYCTKTISCTNRKARKSHECCECGREIVKGEQYEYYFGLDDSYKFIHKTCNDCLSIRDMFYCNGYIWGYVLRQLEEHIVSNNGKISSDCITGLTPAAKDVVFEMIQRVWMEDEEEC